MAMRHGCIAGLLACSTLAGGCPSDDPACAGFRVLPGDLRIEGAGPGTITVEVASPEGVLELATDFVEASFETAPVPDELGTHTVTVTCPGVGRGRVNVAQVIGDEGVGLDDECARTTRVECVAATGEVDAGMTGGGGHTDPENDCGESSGTTTDGCNPDVDIVTLGIDKSMTDLVCIEVGFRGGTPISDPGDNRERRGCSFLPADRTDSLSISCTWNPTTMTWDATANFLRSSTPDHVLEDPEGCRIVGDRWVFCVRPSKLPYEIGEFGCSGQTTYPDGETEHDKTGNLPFEC